MAGIVVFVTAKDKKEGLKIARILVEKKLAACCNIITGIRSVYRWQAKICEDGEVLLVIKTVRKNFLGLEKTVRANHSYSVPEVIALPIVAGSKPYLKWLADCG